MKKIWLYTLSSLLFINLTYADSSCWPEEKLIGTNAIGFIKNLNLQNINKSGQFSFNKTRQKKSKCNVKAYSLANSKKGKLISCDQICYVHGECGINAEYPLLSFYNVVGSNFQIRLKNSNYVWLRFETQPDIKLVTSIGQVGRFYPLTPKLYKLPNSSEIKPPRIQNIAYKIFNIVKFNKEEWVQVKGYNILSDHPPIKLGEELIAGYFRSRDKNKKIKTVLSDLWCD